jgi:hypothetical protein
VLLPCMLKAQQNMTLVDLLLTNVYTSV